MLVFCAVHFLVGIWLGLRFRFGVVLAVAAVVTIEGVIAQHIFQSWPWYFISLGALLASQAGYVASAFVVSQLRPAVSRSRANLPSEVAR